MHILLKQYLMDTFLFCASQLKKCLEQLHLMVYNMQLHNILQFIWNVMNVS